MRGSNVAVFLIVVFHRLCNGSSFLTETRGKCLINILSIVTFDDSVRNYPQAEKKDLWKNERNKMKEIILTLKKLSSFFDLFHSLRSKMCKYVIHLYSFLLLAIIWIDVLAEERATFHKFCRKTLNQFNTRYSN